MKLILVSFDWRRAKDPLVALGHASVAASLKPLIAGKSIELHNLSYNMNDLELTSSIKFDEFIRNSFLDISSRKPDIVAFGAFVWNESCIQRIGNLLERSSIVKKIILAGPQISYAKIGLLEQYYPFGSIFIRGYAEKPLYRLIDHYYSHGLESNPLIPGVHYAGEPDMGLQGKVELDDIPSPFLGDDPVIAIAQNQEFIRWESQRGCPFRCSFCQHVAAGGKTVCKGLSRIEKEINYFKALKAKDIAVLDPTFNSGPNYIQTLKYFDGFKGKISLQCRFEMIKDDFLSICKYLRSRGCDITLEFGIQTVHNLESKACRRLNNLRAIQENAAKLRLYDIPYEISLIYGLPHQTISSFQNSIDFCQRLEPKRLVAWPLMLLRGTEMYERKKEFGLVEKILNEQSESARAELGIPHVVSSPSFSEKEWMKMRDMALNL